MDGFLSCILGKAPLISPASGFLSCLESVPLFFSYVGGLQFRCFAGKSPLLGPVDAFHTCIVGKALLLSPASGFLSCLESMALFFIYAASLRPRL